MDRLQELQDRRKNECRLTPDRALDSLEEAEEFLRDRGLLTRTADSALPILDPICRAELARMEAEDPGWGRLLRHLAEAGPSRVEDLRLELGLKTPELRRLRAPLERCGAIVSSGLVIESDTGHVHTSELARWDQVFPEPADGDSGLDDLLVVALRAASSRRNVSSDAGSAGSGASPEGWSTSWSPTAGWSDPSPAGSAQFPRFLRHRWRCEAGGDSVSHTAPRYASWDHAAAPGGGGAGLRPVKPTPVRGRGETASR